MGKRDSRLFRIIALKPKYRKKMKLKPELLIMHLICEVDIDRRYMYGTDHQLTILRSLLLLNSGLTHLFVSNSSISPLESVMSEK